MSKLQKILVRARRQVFSEMVGNNPSIFQGEGYDFIELREYMPGDDIRHIDWNITAKLQKPYIKIFREERELNIVIASMLNGSVYFGSKRFKQDVIAEVTAMLSFSAIKNGDLVSSYIFSEQLESFLKPSKKLFQVHKSIDEILNFDPLNKKADYKVLADTLFKRLKRKSLIVIVGDFFEIPDFKVLAKKHEVVAVIVRDRLEERPPEMGFTSLVDPESGAVLEGDFNAQTVKEYAKKVLVHDRKLYATFRKHQIRFTKIYTDGKIGVSLRRLFEGR
ncbi:DUF58 domain-containing protein [Sulfurimonas sp. SWIR-19]|uniref:DUF58 domain-containing protein n=1 Tax=Sulfurimonas sp. SWIR-19 TaxID=2878390 RepID=UPI001CF24191|nr:DUF58 domain-containing protein [Sulfurimonas sp. SWIR-19]UCN01009.1 DUF58 domain-containing protein [Sulfurimonas sp. SWIR-19]